VTGKTVITVSDQAHDIGTIGFGLSNTSKIFVQKINKKNLQKQPKSNLS